MTGNADFTVGSFCLVGLVLALGAWIMGVMSMKEKDIRPLNRRLRDDEYERVFDYMMNLGLTNGFTQEAASAETGYVPAFNGEGVIQENLQGEQTA